MNQITINEASENLTRILEQVAKGEHFVIIQQGEELAHILPAKRSKKLFPSLNCFRNSIVLKGIPISTMIVQEREEER